MYTVDVFQTSVVMNEEREWIEQTVPVETIEGVAAFQFGSAVAQFMKKDNTMIILPYTQFTRVEIKMNEQEELDKAKDQPDEAGVEV